MFINIFLCCCILLSLLLPLLHNASLWALSLSLSRWNLLLHPCDIFLYNSSITGAIFNPACTFLRGRLYLCRRYPWSRTCRSRFGRAGPGVATWPRGWGRTRWARRCWRWGKGNPGWWQLSAPSLSPSERWPATGEGEKHFNHPSLK